MPDASPLWDAGTYWDSDVSGAGGCVGDFKSLILTDAFELTK